MPGLTESLVPLYLAGALGLTAPVALLLFLWLSPP